MLLAAPVLRQWSTVVYDFPFLTNAGAARGAARVNCYLVSIEVSDSQLTGDVEANRRGS